MANLVWLDTETTGLNPEIHDVWEIAIITDAGDEYAWQIKPDLTHADPKALEVGGYWGRHFAVLVQGAPSTGTCMATQHPTASEIGRIVTAEEVAATLAVLLNGAVVIGSNPDFDRGFLRSWLRRHGQVWAAHYRTIDVITLGWGRLIAADSQWAAQVPVSSHDVSRAHGIDPDGYVRHTALGDTRWVRDLYRAITGQT